MIPPKTILVIEDNDDIRENIKELLELSGFEILSAPNGADGIDIAMKSHPKFIICDIAMPVKNGYEVLETLKPHLNKHNTPFIFLTASAQEREIAAGKTAGVDAYLTKPFQEEELLEIIDDLLKKKSSPERIKTSTQSWS